MATSEQHELLGTVSVCHVRLILVDVCFLCDIVSLPSGLTSSHLKSEREIDSLCEELMQAARDHCDDLRRDLKHKTAVSNT